MATDVYSPDGILIATAADLEGMRAERLEIELNHAYTKFEALLFAVDSLDLSETQLKTLRVSFKRGLKMFKTE
jgi:hypothetical protein